MNVYQPKVDEASLSNLLPIRPSSYRSLPLDQGMNIVWVLSAALLSLVSTSVLVEAQACGARVRKPWEDLTTLEKNTYKGALAAAMDSGEYIKFVEMHTDMQSEMEAHRQCMFIYWHRLLLVVFENMLRAQGPQFACVTVPYWNWLEANNRLLAGTCSSVGDCSTITRDLGGFTTGRQQTITINGVRCTGRCVPVAPLDHFCQSGGVSGPACNRCVPRSNWATASVPSSTSFASVRQQLFSGQNIGQMSTNIERGCHNSVHSSLASTMSSMSAPADPMFWSHHAMVDALHTIFHKCLVGTQRLTFAQKEAHPVAWTSCAKRNGGTFNPSDEITMRTGVNGNNPIPGSLDLLVGKYFADVPRQYAGLMDVRDLGDSSYTYQLSGQLAEMYNDCGGNLTATSTTATPSSPPLTSGPTATAPQPVVAAPQPAAVTPQPAATTPQPVAAAPQPVVAAPQPVVAAPQPVVAAPQPVVVAPQPVVAAPQPVFAAPQPVFAAPPPATAAPRRATAAPPQPIRRSWLDGLRNRWGFGRRLESAYGWSWSLNILQGDNDRESDDDENTNAFLRSNAPAVVLQTSSTTTSLHHSCNNNNMAVILVEKESPEAKLVSSWYRKTMADMGGECPKAIADLERQMCMFEDQCLGGIAEYTPEFKATWGVEEPRCLTIVKAIKSRQQKITYGKWREDMESSFGCPKPANATQPAEHDRC